MPHTAGKMLAIFKLRCLISFKNGEIQCISYGIRILYGIALQYNHVLDRIIKYLT